MNPPESNVLRAARWLTFGSAASVLFSIAISQILLALAVAALLVSGEKLQLPRIKWPLALFLLGTIISLAFSGEPAAGLPQIRKFYVFLELLVVFSTFRDLRTIRVLFLTWGAIGGLIAVRSFVQFAGKVRVAHELHRSFYEFYVPERITGFMSHWMTFSGEEMFALIMLGAFLLFAAGPRRRWWIWIACAVLMSIALLLGFTRSIWLGAGAAALYLAWFWRRWLVALVPVLVVVAFVASPASIRERFTSLLHPESGVDSNQHRIVTWRTGIRMIEQHPLLGVGPEGVKLHFDEYVPADIPRPLPEGWYGHLHNIYLQYAAERGIPTMLMMMWLLIQVLVDFWRGVRALPPGRSEPKYLLHGSIAVVLATMVEGFFEFNLGDSEVLTMFLVVVACGYLALEKEVTARESASV
ncbi:MAG TPA: O-antigen ligase family protein [Bryobacteraceae bacterium]|nr:O-antigen ligase family protein [Bryobacteraceae bacterium]